MPRTAMPEDPWATAMMPVSWPRATMLTRSTYGGGKAAGHGNGRWEAGRGHGEGNEQWWGRDVIPFIICDNAPIIIWFLLLYKNIKTSLGCRVCYCLNQWLNAVFVLISVGGIIIKTHLAQ